MSFSPLVPHSPVLSSSMYSVLIVYPSPSPSCSGMRMSWPGSKGHWQPVLSYFLKQNCTTPWTLSECFLPFTLLSFKLFFSLTLVYFLTILSCIPWHTISFIRMPSVSKSDFISLSPFYLFVFPLKLDIKLHFTQLVKISFVKSFKDKFFFFFYHQVLASQFLEIWFFY